MPKEFCWSPGQLPAALDKENPHAESSFTLTNVRVRLVTGEGMVRVANMARGILTDLEHVEGPAYAHVARRDAGSGSRENLRAYLGTIPDYAAEVQGVKLSGVRAGGPADKAGLMAAM